MAKASSVFLFLFLFTVASVWGRNTPKRLETTTLDVTDTLKRAVEEVSAVSTRQHDSPATKGLTLSLQPRDMLQGSEVHTDLESFTLDRLGRDSKRIEYITNKLHLSLSGNKNSDLTPVETESFKSSIISGMSQGSGEYFTTFQIGSPSIEAYMVVDTGSDLTWIQCQPCTECYKQNGRIFDPSSSSSYSPLSCLSPECTSLDMSTCRSNSCLYQVSYGDGSYSVGDFVTELVGLGSSTRNVALGCGHDNEGLFVAAAGLLGLGRGPLSFPSQIRSSAFSYCLVDRFTNSSSTLDFDAVMSKRAMTAPLLSNPKMSTFYYAEITGISVGGKALRIPSSIFEIDEEGTGGMIVDSGTAVTRLQREAYVALRDAFLERSSGLPRADSMALFDTCFDLSSKKTVDVPVVSFNFRNGVLPLTAKNFLIPVKSDGTYCLAFASTNSPLSIIGNVQQQGMRVTYDLAGSLIGFEPNRC